MDNQYDHEGEIISTLKISCDCNTANVGDYGENILQLSNICSDKKMQDDLINIIARYRPNSLIIYNCQNPIVFESLNYIFPHIAIDVNR